MRVYFEEPLSIRIINNDPHLLLTKECLLVIRLFNCQEQKSTIERTVGGP